MTDGAVIGAFVFMVLCLLLVGFCSLLVHLAHDWAADRERERRYADEWQAAHRARQDRDRYLTDDPNRPE